jgi:outer membrane protein OmpA-like peptidoglycan-associated protein
MNTTVTLARQASQTAEDARILTMERKHAGELASANDRVTRAEAARDQAEAARQAAQAQAGSARALLEQERAARKQAEAAAAAYNSGASVPPPPQPQRSVTNRPAFYPDEPQKKELRRQLLGQLGNTFPSLDTPRGITVTIPDSDFQGARLNSAVSDRMVRIAAILRAHPDLTVKVEGHQTYSSERAGAVREALIAGGLPSEAVMARGWGDSRPIASNATVAGREQNCRVEIVVGGTSIGDLPNWAHSYQLAPGQ